MVRAKDYFLAKIRTLSLIIILLLIAEFFSYGFLAVINNRRGNFFIQPGIGRVYYFDVGQGDATLINGPGGENILLDGGPDLSVVYALGQALPFYDRQIDLLILTHPDYDHLIGLIEVIKRYQVRQIVINGILDDSPAYQYFLQTIEDKKIDLDVVQAGENFTWSGFKVEILYPFFSLANQIVADNNASSLVIKITYGKIGLLFTGDLPLAQEAELIASGLDLQSQAVKAGHHGSKTSTGLAFLRAVNPAWVIISAGRDNRYGHPHYRVLSSIKKVGAEALRTDWQGTIKLLFSADNIAVSD